MTYPHVPAAFINAISEEGTKAEAVDFLQKQWNENCALRAELKALRLPAQQTRTCATCHAVLADGPQPASTYEAQGTEFDLETKVADIIKENAGVGYSFKDGHIDGNTLFVAGSIAAAHMVLHFLRGTAVASQTHSSKEDKAGIRIDESGRWPSTPSAPTSTGGNTP